jgi:hypothetical protein
VTRYSRKKISVDLLRKLFPDEPLPGRNNNNTPIDHKCAGMMQVMRPLRRTLRSSPPRNINEMDLSELSAFRWGGLISYFIYLYCLPQNLRECHFVELLNVSSLLWFSFFKSLLIFFFSLSATDASCFRKFDASMFKDVCSK